MSSDLWWAIWGPTIFYCIICIGIGVAFGFACRAIIYNKGYSENWFWWGFFFGWIAIVVALTKPDIRSQQGYNAPLSALDQSAKERDEAYTLNHGGWRCYNCRSVNLSYVGTCQCGMTRTESKDKELEVQQLALERNKKIEEAKKPKTVAESSEDAIKLAEAITKFKELLDMGVITQEEFDEKKNSLLSNAKTVEEEASENTDSGNIAEATNSNWNCANCGHENDASTKCCSYCGSIKMIDYSSSPKSITTNKQANDPIQSAVTQYEEPQQETVPVTEPEAPAQPSIQDFTGQLSYCPICNGEIHVGDKFCTNCGTELTWTMG